MSMPGTMGPGEDWQAKGDANTLIEAEIIKADQPRFLKAQQAAEAMLQEESDRADAIEKLAKANLNYKMPDFGRAPWEIKAL